MRTFFNYHGGKFRSAPSYPHPVYRTVVEPFAGGAGYSLRHPNCDIYLNDIDPIIYGIWSYLINVSEHEILSLPTLVEDTNLLDVPQEAKWLIGFWLNPGSSQPRTKPSTWAKNPLPGRLNTYWGDGVKARIASQLKYIRHWKITNLSYSAIPTSKQACYFIDPPYMQKGSNYKYKTIDYGHLSLWCRSIKGQVIVCEGHGATWLPFSHHKYAKAQEGATRSGVSSEVIWTNT